MRYLEFVLLAVDNDGADLLVHENEDGDEERRDGAGHVNPPRVLTERHHQPAATRSGWLVGDDGPQFQPFTQRDVHILDRNQNRVEWNHHNIHFLI